MIMFRGTARSKVIINGSGLGLCLRVALGLLFELVFGVTV